jgi:glycosyltransferase involved in cell wall biosynthesis
MGKPLISVIIPALNEEHFLPNLLESLASQTNRNFEVIVVDGKSKDKTVEVAKSFEKRLPGLQVLIADHANLPFQRNTGARQANGDWLVFLDADNVMLPYALERIMVFVEEGTHEFFTSWTRPDSVITQDVLFALFINAIMEGSILVKRPFSPGPFTAVKKTVFDAIGGYTDGLKWGEDVDFSNKAQKAGFHFSILREVLYIWSMRRLRADGKLKFIQQSAKATFYLLLTNKAFTKGYEMGGHLYEKKKKRTKQSPAKKMFTSFSRFAKEVLK